MVNINIEEIPFVSAIQKETYLEKTAISICLVFAINYTITDLCCRCL